VVAYFERSWPTLRISRGQTLEIPLESEVSHG
jgi:hypothetical protein